MTEPPRGGLVAGTLADLRTLMGKPAGVRRGMTQLVKPANPAAGASFTYKVDPAFWERIVAVTFQLVTSAAVANRSVVLQYQDQDGFTFTQVPVWQVANASMTQSAFGDLSGVSPVGAPESLINYAAVAAPGAGATIVFVSAIPPGNYLVQWTVEVSGTLAAGTDNDNVRLTTSGGVSERAIYPAVAGTYPQQSFETDSQTLGNFVASAIGAATAGSTYAVSVSASPLSGIGAQLELPDIILKPSWQLVISVGNVQAADQISAIGIMTERYSSEYASGTLGLDIERVLEQLER